MSSISVSYSRKRLHSPAYRGNSDSEDELPPVKIKKKIIGNKIPVAFSAKLKNFALWISELPVKGFFAMAIKAGSTLPEETIIIDDNDDDVVTIEEDESEKPNPFTKRLQQSRKHLVLNNQRFRRELELNGSLQSGYHSRSREVTVAYDSRYDLPKSHNGSNSWKPRSSGNSTHNLHPHHQGKYSSPISNPDTDVEILLDSKDKVSSPETDEIEIISESPKPSCSQKQMNETITIKNVTSLSGPPESNYTRFQSASAKSYTAHEVSRLQEKVQYQLLLQKYISGNHYHNPVKKVQDNAEVEIIPDCLEFTGAHFKKEILQQPVNNFLEKYCKPCQLVTHEKPKKDKEKQNEVIEITIDDDDDDDNEVEVVDVKLPKYKATYKHKPDFFSTKWINELKKTVHAQTEERLRIVQEYERAVEKYKKERLLKRLNYGIELETSETALPALTPEMEEMIDKAVIGDPAERICNSITSDAIYRKDIETLAGLNWLNDLVINSYLDLIVDRSKQEGFPSVYAYNTFFYTNYKANGYSNVRRWTRKTDIFSYDYNFIPLHLGIHWCLGVIDHKLKRICYYDSMNNNEEQCLDLLHDYVCLEHKDKKGSYLDPSAYTTEIVKGIPQQMNGCDCGIFTLKYAEYISRNAKITFSQKDMPYFRRRTIFEIITGKLL